MYCLALVDIGTFILSIIFFFTTFRTEECYSEECPPMIKLWLVLAFLNLYTIQFAIYAYFKTKNRKVSFLIWFLTSFVLVPEMFVVNVWGNMMIETMDNTTECVYNGYAQWFQMLYLISAYCIVFVYCIFLLTIKETMKRYYVLIQMSDEEYRRAVRIHNVNIACGRSFSDMCDSLAYSLYLINEGRIGSRAEREYIQAERAKKQFAVLNSSIKQYKYEVDSDDDAEDIESVGSTPGS